jgi:HD-GYP domain-containing protein (c-di-GMP phosphodiesterase class II)
MAGIVHDLGKIFIPSEILNKPGRLSPVEFALIKEHPKAAYDVLKNLKFPWPIAKIILQHHERLDGSGYPNGLKNDAICIEAKIIAVADVIEAMASHRPYRPALGMEEALKEIMKNRGVLFDPAVVDASIEILS